MIQAIGIVIPAHNEERTIGNVVRQCLDSGPVVMVVDDGSIDGTRREALAAGAKVVSLREHSGYGSALQIGFRESKQLGHQIVVTLDADGAHDPAFISNLVESHLSNNAQVTVGSRFIDAQFASQIPSSKVAANYFATALFNLATGSSFTDVASGMRVLDASALDLPCQLSHFDFTYGFLAAAYRSGMKIIEERIPVRYDAEKLFCTKRGELSDFLHSIVLLAGTANRQVMPATRRILDAIELHKIFRIHMNPRYLVAHPLADFDAYVFQFQDSHLVGHYLAEEWISYTEC